MPNNCGECPIPSMLNELNSGLPEDQHLTANSDACDTQFNNCNGFGKVDAICTTTKEVANKAMKACGHSCPKATDCMVAARNQERTPGETTIKTVDVDALAALL